MHISKWTFHEITWHLGVINNDSFTFLPAGFCWQMKESVSLCFVAAKSRKKRERFLWKKKKLLNYQFYKIFLIPPRKLQHLKHGNYWKCLLNGNFQRFERSFPSRFLKVYLKNYISRTNTAGLFLYFKMLEYCLNVAL